MDNALYANHRAVLSSELVCALGCTEPIAIAYAAALARAALGEMPQHMSITCSGNIIKNVKSVTVPNSLGMKGIEAAAVLGVLGGDYTQSLEVLSYITPEHIVQTKELLARNFCTVHLKEDVPNLYVRCVVTNDVHTACATIKDRHTNICELSCDDAPATLNCELEIHTHDCARNPESSHTQPDRSQLTLTSIWEFIHEAALEDIQEPIERQITCNQAIAEEGLTGSWGTGIGKTLLTTRPDDITVKARAYAAAGSDARMSGCPMPVVIVCGSGNQGMTCSLPVIQYAQELGVSRDTLIRAVALSDLIAVHVKHYIGELSAFCGAVSAAAGAGCAICYLKGGTLKQIEMCIVNTLANVGGIVCDGAKSSCAAKIASSVDAAILACDMALAGSVFEAGDGLVCDTAEKTIESMGYVGRVGMHPTDVEILNIMIGKTDTSLHDKA